MKIISDEDVEYIEAMYGTITTLKQTSTSTDIVITEFGLQAFKTFKFVEDLDKCCGGNTEIKSMNNEDGIMNITLVDKEK